MPRGRYVKYARNHFALIAGIHDYDLANWFLDAEPTVVQASSVDSAGTSPDLLWAFLEYPRDCPAVVETAWVLPDDAGLWLEAELEVIGTVGVAHLHFPSDALSLYLQSGQERPDTTAVVDALGQQVGSLVDELSYIAHCVATGQPRHASDHRTAPPRYAPPIAVAEAAATKSLCPLGHRHPAVARNHAPVASLLDAYVDADLCASGALPRRRSVSRICARPYRHLGAMPLLVMHAHSGTSPAFVVCAQAVVRYGMWIT
jgi:hypothetical protein